MKNYYDDRYENYERERHDNNKNKNNKVLAVIMVVLLLGTNLCTYFLTAKSGLFTGNQIVVDSDDEVSIKYINKLLQLKEVLKENYYKELDDKQLWEYAIKGLFAGAQDPYTSYMTEDEYKEFVNSLESEEFCGIGISMLADETGYVKVIRVFDNSPADKAGVKPGDYIVSIDGKDAYELTASDVSDVVRGEEGSSVKIEFMRDGKTYTKQLTRSKISVSNISSKMIDGNIGYIHLYEFTTDIDKDFEKALDKLLDNGAKGIIIDLRDNPGGLVNECLNIAELFLKKGDLIVSTTDKSKKVEKYSDKTDRKINVPVVVLINSNSASSSEILAGALKDNGVATLVGEISFGKGIIQTFNSLNDDTGIRITTSEYLTPSGKSIHGVGIKPDVEVKLDKDVIVSLLKEKDDKQLQEAIKQIKNKISK